jgi:putative hydrolase of the HAD superfamily
MEKSVSFDVWGTLLKSNDLFKYHQNKLAKNYGVNNFLEQKSQIKKEVDQIIEKTGIHPDRFKLYQKIFQNYSIRDIQSFILESDQLFLKYPPHFIKKGVEKLEEFTKLNYIPLISSNTVFIHSNILHQIIFNEFYIPKSNCNYSDILGVSKPNEDMFKFRFKPTYHIGDNIITDGSCEKYNIKFLNINENI